MRCLVVGGGAVGQYLAARLAQAGHHVVVMARDEQAKALNSNGIQLRTDIGTATIRVQAAAHALDASVAQPFELAIVAVKSYSTEGAAHAIAALPACQGSSVLTVQNGLGNEEILAKTLGEQRIVAGALTVAVDRLDTTSIAAASKGGLCIAPLGADPHNWIIAAFGSRLSVKAAANWRALKWSKLLINILANGVCAALDWLPEQVYGDRDAFAFERLCLLEAIDVMSRLQLMPLNLSGFPVALLAASAKTLPAGLLRLVLGRRVTTGRGGKLPSLLMDLRAHRPQTEVTALNGAVAERAVSAGAEAPANAAVSNIVEGVASGRLAWSDYRGKPQRLFQALSR